jgi:hypothetical protein
VLYYETQMIKCKPDLLGLQCAVLLISDDKVYASLFRLTMCCTMKLR